MNILFGSSLLTDFFNSRTLLQVTALLHPKLINPETGQASDRSDFPSLWPIGEVTPTGFTFEHPWELVPGTWTVRVIWDWKVVAEKTFNVVLPR